MACLASGLSFTSLFACPPPCLCVMVVGPVVKQQRVGYVTLLFGSSEDGGGCPYLPGVLTLLQSLRESNTTAQLVVMIGPGVSQSHRHQPPPPRPPFCPACLLPWARSLQS